MDISKKYNMNTWINEPDTTPLPEYGLRFKRHPVEITATNGEIIKEGDKYEIELKLLDSIKGKSPKGPEHILMESDNYLALKYLQYTHEDKIDVIYIDPPYNTGAKDWKYNNDYVDKEDIFKHSKWLSFMEKRLKLAKKLLKPTGFIIIAIDHYELFTLGMLCDQIFNETNRVGIVNIVHKPEGRQHDRFFSPSNEYMLVYAKNKDIGRFNKTTISFSKSEQFTLEDDIGKFMLKPYLNNDIESRSLESNKPHFYYPIFVSKDLKTISLTECKECHEIFPITKQGIKKTWITIKKTTQKRIDNNILVAKEINGNIEIYYKFREQQRYTTHWTDTKYNATAHGTTLLKNLLGTNAFDFPKSVYAIKDSLKITLPKNGICLDFFAGSGTTFQAVAELNEEDGGTRQCILVTNNESNICRDVTWERVKRVTTGTHDYPECTKKYDGNQSAHAAFYTMEVKKL
jgi:adenine-specific DNA-methyltransferase